MNIANKSVLITGANRGIGRALVDEALRRGAKQVYAAARSPFQHADKRVTPLVLDVTDTAQIARAAGAVENLDVLINNAGIAIYDDLSHPEVIEQHMAVNVFGTLKVTRASCRSSCAPRAPSSTTCRLLRSLRCPSFPPTPFPRRPDSTLRNPSRT